MRLLWMLCAWMLLFAPLLAAQEPIPYDPDEFPEWAKATGRFEAIFIGAIPLAIFFGSIGYDIYRYSHNYALTGQSDPRYLPGLISPAHQPFSSEEQQTVFWIALGVAGAVAIIDLVIDQVKRRRGTR